MDPKTERIAEGLRRAMQAEHEGQHFYLMAAKSTMDSRGREVFQTLANDEVDHFNFLKGHYASILKTGRIDSSLKLRPRTEFKGEHPIFSDEIKARIGNAHFEMTAVSIGIQLELSAVKFYKAEAEAAKDPEVKAFYEELAAWEQGHLNALQSEASALKEEYWERGGFAPF